MADWDYEWEKISVKFWLWLAGKLPRRLAYWSYIVQGMGAMRPEDVVPEVGYAELLRRMHGGE